jgi:drug/metabolite transporter (DMT)-like permease
MPFISGFFITPDSSGISFAGWAGLWYMAVFPTAIGYTLYYVGVQKRGPAWAATYIYLVPSFTANLDYLFFKAQFSLAMVAGTTMVVLGLLLGNISQSQINSAMIKIGFRKRNSTGD